MHSFVVRADNRGEGGILALMSLTPARWRGKNRYLLVIGLIGAALLYGDGFITPAISVLSAVEDLKVASNAFEPYTTYIAAAILFALFAVQRFRTAKLSFGPLMTVRFLIIRCAWHRRYSAKSARYRGLPALFELRRADRDPERSRRKYRPSVLRAGPAGLAVPDDRARNARHGHREQDDHHRSLLHDQASNGRTAHPVGKCPAVELDALPGVSLRLTIQRKMIGVF
jgi:hypothetical protein